jgi:hypothetical protein
VVADATAGTVGRNWNRDRLNLLLTYRLSVQHQPAVAQFDGVAGKADHPLHIIFLLVRGGHENNNVAAAGKV